MLNVNKFFLFRQVINKTRAYLSPGRAQIICFESVPPPIVLSVRNSDITFCESSRGVVYDMFSLCNHALCVITVLFFKGDENVQLQFIIIIQDLKEQVVSTL